MVKQLAVGNLIIAAALHHIVLALDETTTIQHQLKASFAEVSLELVVELKVVTESCRLALDLRRGVHNRPHIAL